MHIRLLRKRSIQSPFGMLLLGMLACGRGDSATMASTGEDTTGDGALDGVSQSAPGEANTPDPSSSNPASSKPASSASDDSAPIPSSRNPTPLGEIAATNGAAASGEVEGAAPGGIGEAPSGGDPAGGAGLPSADSPSNWVFDANEVRTYELALDPAVWEALQQNARDEEYAEAGLIVEGTSLSRVGLRFKGSVGTLGSCFADDGTRTCSKLSMKIKFDEYLPEQRFLGLKRLNFNSSNRDPSLMRERLAYHLFREFGVVAPRAVHAVLVVNGASLGLFTLVEDIDGRFTDDRFAGGDGNLYKEAWPDSDDVNFLDQHLETNEETSDHTLLLQFFEELRASPPEGLPAVVERYMGIDALSAYLAVDRTITNWDGPTAFYCYESTCENHNYFLYQHENEPRFTLIPWDLDHTFEDSSRFDGVPDLFEIPQDCGPNEQNIMAPACDRLLQGYVRGGRAAYLAAVERLLAGPFALANLESRLAAWQAQVEPVVSADGFGPGIELFHEELEILRGNLVTLHERALAELQSGL